MQAIFRRFMWLTLKSSVLLLLWLFGNAHSAYAQSCDPVIANLSQAINQCSDINSNWVCYASQQADATPSEYRFYQTRDRRPFPVLQEVKTIDNQGVVLMNLQLKNEASPIKVIVLGKLDIENSDPTKRILKLGFSEGQYLCNDTPPSLMVQTAEGTSGVVTVNGVDITLGSTALVTLQANGQMAVVNIEGHVKVTIGGITQALLVGQQSLIAFSGGQPAFAGQPTASPFFASPVAQWLASTGLPRIHNTNTTPDQCVGEIKFGETITTQNIAPGQECLYHFCAKAGDAVTVQMDAIDPTFDPWLDLRGPGGWLIGYNDDFKSDDQDSLLCNRALPLTSCDYTVVARSTRNQSKGQFKLTLNHQSTCLQPQPRCAVVAPQGIGLRAGPSINEKVIQTLSANAKLLPLDRTSDGAWAHVQVLDTIQEGWVSQAPGSIECEDDAGLMPVTDGGVKASSPDDEESPSPTATPTPPRKVSPFGTP